MMNHKRPSVPRLLMSVALAITLVACSSGPKEPESVDITSAPSQSIETYMIKADSSQGNLQNDWLIMAAKAAVKAGQAKQTDLLLKRIEKLPLTEIQQAEWQLTRAKLYKLQQMYSQLVAELNFKPWWHLSDKPWIEFYSLRADAYEHLDKPFEANRELVGLGKFITSDDQQASLARHIWRNFAGYSQFEITKLVTEPDEDVLDGWLQLAIYMKTLSGNVPQLKNTLEHWLAENPNHPAALYTPQSIKDILSLQIVKPTHNALLLPLSGKFSKQAKLIRDGFIFSMLNDSDRDKNATLTVIDTNANTADDIKKTLLANKIDFMVGPLIKENIESLQKDLQADDIHIPALALNIPSEIEKGNDTCYFTLSPEQEVSQAAKYLFSQGLHYPLILAPEGHYGERVVKAFSDEWAKYSQNKVAVQYFGDKRHLQRNIDSVFGLQDSKQRIAQMDELMNIPLQTEARSRRDIDAVYIVANSAELTLIKPFIEVAVNPDAKPPKLFSNSRSNSSSKQYEDLSGIIYSDIPLLVNRKTGVTDEMNKLWPDQSNQEKRLEALGMDAYKLLEELPQMKVVPGYTIKGETGNLSLDDNCVVQRQLSWAEHAGR